MPKDYFDSLEETVYLLRSPANAQCLTESLERVRRGKYTERELIED